MEGPPYCAERRCIGCLFLSAEGGFSWERARELQRERNGRCRYRCTGIYFSSLSSWLAIIPDLKAVLLDAVYDGIEFFMLLPSIFLIPLLYKPSDEKIPLRSYADGDGISGY